MDSNYNPQANKEITFMINGVEYTRNTDNNGEASIAINLQPGNYEIITKNSEYQVANRIIVLSTLIDQYVDNVTINSDENEKYNVMILDGNGNPYPNQPVTFKYANQIEKVMTDENGIAGFEAKRINEYRPIGIEYNGYEIIKCMQYGVQFKKYPYVPADRTENEYIPIKLIDIINPNVY